MLPMRQLAGLLRRRALSPVELVEAYLSRIQERDARLHSFITVDASGALAAAREAERRIAARQALAPLCGIPVALKDLIDTASLRTTAGSRILCDRIPARDATVTRRLRAAGAIVLGKLTLHEFGMGVPDPDGAFPAARNPWDLDRVPGGSSSGSAVALAAGLCAGSVGTDTGGSIRQPAAHTGVVGLKPTCGLVGRSGVIPLSPSLDHVGPMGRTVDDVALLLQAIAGHDDGDPASLPLAWPDWDESRDTPLPALRVGVPTAWIVGTREVLPDVLELFERALEVLRNLGAKTTEVALPSLGEVETAFSTILLSEALEQHRPWLRQRRQAYGRGFLHRIERGLRLTADDVRHARESQATVCRELADVMTTIDVIAMPAMPWTAPTFAEETGPDGRRSLWTSLFNLTGQPSVSLPCGFDRRGLPVGLLISGRWGEDSLLLRLAYAVEREYAAAEHVGPAREPDATHP